MSYSFIDRSPNSRENRMNSCCVLSTDASRNKFNVDAIVFVSQKKKHIHLSLKKPLYKYPDHRIN